MAPSRLIVFAALLTRAVARDECAGSAECAKPEEQEEVSALQSSAPRRHNTKKPHVLFILADDYGWANFGSHRECDKTPADRQGQAEVNTPNLDNLVKTGVLLERHYAYRICSPSRSSLQSGRLAVHVNSVNTGVTFWQPADNVSGFAGIPRAMTGMAQKMKKGGYCTHMVGKWDAGMATPQHTPLGKGYDSWMGYFQHANDYWQEGLPFSSTGTIDVCQNRFVDFSLYNATYRGPVSDEIRRELGCNRRNMHVQTPGVQPQVNATGCGDSRRNNNSRYCLPDSCYEEALFNEYALKIIREHDTRVPLFLFYAFHLLHTPLQMPQSYLDRLDWLVKKRGGRKIETQNRRYYAAMTLYLDDMVGKVVAALKAKHMYDDTLIVFTADNGGPIYEPGSANNWPLKGGKYSDWEGGIRTNAFVSGGWVPEWRRGKKFDGVISIADWYATLSTIAGVDYFDKEAAEANRYLLEKQLPPLHPVDGRPQWDHIVKDTNGRKDPLHLSSQAVLVYPWKLVTGAQEYSSYQGPLYPNCSTVRSIADGPLPSDLGVYGQHILLSSNATEQDRLTFTTDCGGGCLYNVEADPTEHHDLSSSPEYADLLFKMQTTLYELNLRNFNPDRGSPALQACQTAAGLGGFYGPFVDAQRFYKGVPPLTPLQQKRERVIVAELTKLNRSLERIPDVIVQQFVDSFGVVDFFSNRDRNASIDVCYLDTPR